MVCKFFKEGQEVTVQTRGLGDVCTFKHLKVARLAGAGGAMVVLEDGSRWTHGGDRWGEGKIG